VTVAQHLAAEITKFNTEHCKEPIGAIGAVVGLTADGSRELVEHLPKSLVLAPGLGAQGGTFEDLRARFGHVAQRVLPSSSREVLRKGPDLAALSEAIRVHAGRSADALG
jgi:orotidine-5'-phosphate decarboxylase